MHILEVMFVALILIGAASNEGIPSAIYLLTGSVLAVQTCRMQSLQMVNYKRRELKAILIISVLVVITKAIVIMSQAIDLSKILDRNYFEAWRLLGLEFLEITEDDKTFVAIYYQGSFVNEIYVLPVTICYLFYLHKVR